MVFSIDQMNRQLFIIHILLSVVSAPSYCQWNKVLEQNEIKVFTKAPDSNMFHYKSIGIINTHRDSLYHFLTNFTYYPNWVNYCSEIKVIDSIPNKDYHYYCYFDVPWPARNRYAIVHLTIQWAADSSKITVNTKASSLDIDTKPLALKVTEFKEQFIIETLDQNQVRFTMQGSYNPGGAIPLKLITKMLKWGPYDTMIKIRSYVE